MTDGREGDEIPKYIKIGEIKDLALFGEAFSEVNIINRYDWEDASCKKKPKDFLKAFKVKEATR